MELIGEFRLRFRVRTADSSTRITSGLFEWIPWSPLHHDHRCIWKQESFPREQEPCNASAVAAFHPTQEKLLRLPLPRPDGRKFSNYVYGYAACGNSFGYGQTVSIYLSWAKLNRGDCPQARGRFRPRRLLRRQRASESYPRSKEDYRFQRSLGSCRA
jgi:hypothetical protein